MSDGFERPILVLAFTNEAICEFVPGMELSTLRGWKSAGHATPSVINVTKRGSRSYWSTRDAVVLRFMMRIGASQFESLADMANQVDRAIPRRKEDMSSGSFLYWNGGRIHLGTTEGGVEVLIDEPAYVSSLFEVREPLLKHFNEAEQAATIIDVARLVREPSNLRGRRPARHKQSPAPGER